MAIQYTASLGVIDYDFNFKTHTHTNTLFLSDQSIIWQQFFLYTGLQNQDSKKDKV